MFSALTATDEHQSSTYAGARRRHQVRFCISLLLGVLVGTLIGAGIAAFFLRPEYGLLLVPATWKNNVSFTSGPTTILDASEDPSLETLRDMVARTKGYWARDYSLHLGWNNVSNYPPDFTSCITPFLDALYNRNGSFTWHTS